MARWTNKRRLFLEHYFACNMNAQEAATRAGFKHPNVKGSQLVKVSIIAEAIDKRLAEMAMDSNEVLARLGKHARITMADFTKVIELDDQGRSVIIVSLQQAKELGVLDCIKKLTHLKDGGYTIELHDAQAALMHLDKHHGGPAKGPIPQIIEVNDVSPRDEIARRLAGIESRERAHGDSSRTE